MRLLKRVSSHYSLFAFLLVTITAVLIYGLSIPSLGFYHDDWYMLWSGASRGSDSLIPLFSLDRPFMGVIYSGFYKLLGATIYGWHWFALVFRIAGAMAFYWILKLVWPNWDKSFHILASILFIVFPGFLAQPHAATKINHLLGYASALFSIALSLYAICSKGKIRRILSIVFALLFEALYLWIYEYMIGLEIMRLLLFFLILHGEVKSKFLIVARKTIQSVIPYISVGVLFLFWRIFIFSSTRSATNLGDLALDYMSDPVTMLISLVIQVIKDFLSVTTFAWFVQAHKLITQASPMQLITALFTAIAIILTIIGGLHLVRNRDISRENTSQWVVLVVSGALITIAAVFPVVFSNRFLDLNDTYKGYGLHPSVGVILLLMGFLFTINPVLRKNIIFLLIFFSLITQSLNTQYWINYWNVQKTLWWQVAWRAPEIADSTLVMAYAPNGFAFREDYEIWGPLNLIYRQRFESWPRIQAQVLNQDTVLEVFKKSFSDGTRVRDIYLPRRYENLLIFSQPTTDSCVHAIDGQLPAYSSSERLIVEQIGSYSNIEFILPNATLPVPPQNIFGDEPEHTWCYYFQQASLARQFGNWPRIGELFDQASAADYQAGDPSEYFVFIEGLINLGREDEAIRLTEEKIERKSALQYSLCKSILSAPEYPKEFGYQKDRIFVIVCDSLDT